jgi:hypothetical protein
MFIVNYLIFLISKEKTPRYRTCDALCFKGVERNAGVILAEEKFFGKRKPHRAMAMGLLTFCLLSGFMGQAGFVFPISGR